MRRQGFRVQFYGHFNSDFMIFISTWQIMIIGEIIMRIVAHEELTCYSKKELI
jgi:hypothetical protein